ncbi:hypothetical protein F5B21DRAFT_68412 [Xylaria acuta]|nr:hypothetical protein F5B21DRAFT_68412 [Xylaria acuta]
MVGPAKPWKPVASRLSQHRRAPQRRSPEHRPSTRPAPQPVSLSRPNRSCRGSSPHSMCSILPHLTISPSAALPACPRVTSHTPHLLPPVPYRNPILPGSPTEQTRELQDCRLPCPPRILRPRAPRQLAVAVARLVPADLRHPSAIVRSCCSLLAAAPAVGRDIAGAHSPSYHGNTVLALNTHPHIVALFVVCARARPTSAPSSRNRGGSHSPQSLGY